jgi:hypothetical protein
VEKENKDEEEEAGDDDNDDNDYYDNDGAESYKITFIDNDAIADDNYGAEAHNAVGDNDSMMFITMMFQTTKLRGI